MSPEERQRLTEERRLIFANLANGVDKRQVMAAFHRSEAEVNREFDFVRRKLAEYRFRRLLPPLACDSAQDLRWNRRALLESLDKLGPEYLASELIIPRVTVHKVESLADAQEATRRAGARSRMV